jgi:hypothetical protein
MISYMYCQTHGKVKVKEARNTKWVEFPGEYAKIVKGRLIVDSSCDFCHKPICAGEMAILIGYFPVGYDDGSANNFFENPTIQAYPSAKRRNHRSKQNGSQS